MLRSPGRAHTVPLQYETLCIAYTFTCTSLPRTIPFSFQCTQHAPNHRLRNMTTYLQHEHTHGVLHQIHPSLRVFERLGTVTRSDGASASRNLLIISIRENGPDIRIFSIYAGTAGWSPALTINV